MNPRVKQFVIIVGGIYILSVLAMRATRGFELEKWHLSIGLLATAALLYLGHYVLTRHFIAKRTPQFASEKEALSIVRFWEQTTGEQVVPQWLSLIRLLSISAGVTAILPWIGGLAQWGIDLLLK